MRTPAFRVTAALLSCAAAVAGALLATGDRAGAAGAGGTLYGWGENSSGQVGIDWVTDLAHPVTQPVAVSVPAGVVQVTTAMGVSGAVRADGSVWIWGSSPWVQGDGGPATRPAPHAVPGLPAIARLSLTWDGALAVGRDGSLWAWGYNDYGELGAATPHGAQLTPVRIVAGGVVDAAMGYSTAAYLLGDGTVWTGGSNTGGGLGNGTLTPRAGFNAAWTPAGVTQLAATEYGFAALRSDGSVWVWGTQYGDTEVATGRLPWTTPKPTRLDALTGIKQISAGATHLLALAKDGTVWAWGDNALGQFGNGYADTNGQFLTKSPVHLALTGVTQVDAADFNGGAIRSDGLLLAWGENPRDRLGLGTTGSYVATPTVKPYLSGVTTAAVGSTAFAVAGSVTVVPRTVVPSVLGDVDAAQTLHAAGLVEGNILTTPDDRYCAHLGEIKTQSPAAGALVVFGSRVDVTVYVRPSQPCL